jgi:hypothetical protein
MQGRNFLWMLALPIFFLLFIGLMPLLAQLESQNYEAAAGKFLAQEASTPQSSPTPDEASLVLDPDLETQRSAPLVVGGILIVLVIVFGVLLHTSRNLAR